MPSRLAAAGSIDKLESASPSKPPTLTTTLAVSSAAGVNASASTAVGPTLSASGKELRRSRKLTVAELLFGAAPAMEGDLPSAMEFVVKVALASRVCVRARAWFTQCCAELLRRVAGAG